MVSTLNRSDGESAVSERRAFLNTVADGLDQDPRFNKVIYQRSTDRRSDGMGRLNTLTVVFNLDWPLDEAPISLEESLPKTAVAAAIFRVKDFLERRLMVPLNLLDIHSGCVRVRYEAPEGVNVWSVLSALQALEAVADSFGVLEAKANISGRAIRA